MNKYKNCIVLFIFWITQSCAPCPLDLSLSSLLSVWFITTLTVNFIELVTDFLVWMLIQQTSTSGIYIFTYHNFPVRFSLAWPMTSYYLATCKPHRTPLTVPAREVHLSLDVYKPTHFRHVHCLTHSSIRVEHFSYEITIMHCHTRLDYVMPPLVIRVKQQLWPYPVHPRPSPGSRSTLSFLLSTHRDRHWGLRPPLEDP